eukprot:10051769-Karenia_brevis.AAC.1
MSYPMTDVSLPPSARGVIRPASRDPFPAPPRQVQRSQMVPAWNDSVPKPPPPVHHARRQILRRQPLAPPRPVGSAATTSLAEAAREVDRLNDEVRQDQIEAKAPQIEATMASTSPTLTPSPSPERQPADWTLNKPKPSI